MVTKLQVYNLALTSMKASTVVANEANEATRTMDDWWNIVTAGALEEGFFKFAMRSCKIQADADVTPTFGYSMAFGKPNDWVKTYDMSLSEFFDPPHNNWIEENNLFFSDSDPLYLRYVSNSVTGYGMDLTRWTSRFTKAVASELAFRSCAKAVGSSDSFKDTLMKQAVIDMSSAKIFEAMRDPPKRIPQGSWTSGRFNGRGRLGGTNRGA